MRVKELKELLEKVRNQDMIIKVSLNGKKHMDISSVGMCGPNLWAYLLLVENDKNER